MGLARIALLALVACSSKPKHVEDARRPAGDAPGEVADSASSDASSATGTRDPEPPAVTTGDAQVRVEWATMPLAARVSPGPSACKTPLAAQVAPTTTWGIPDVVVFVDGAPATVASPVRIAVGACSIAPRIAIGTSVVIASAADHPLRVSLSPRFDVADSKRKLPTASVPIALPIAGHEVTTTLGPSIYRITADGKVDDAWLVGAPATITDASGVALVKDLAPGTYTVRAWLPPRGGQPAREAKAEVTVAVGDLAELTLKLD